MIQLPLFASYERQPRTATLLWIECGHCHGPLSPYRLACDLRCSL